MRQLVNQKTYPSCFASRTALLFNQIILFLNIIVVYLRVVMRSRMRPTTIIPFFSNGMIIFLTSSSLWKQLDFLTDAKYIVATRAIHILRPAALLHAYVLDIDDQRFSTSWNTSDFLSDLDCNEDRAFVVILVTVRNDCLFWIIIFIVLVVLFVVSSHYLRSSARNYLFTRASRAKSSFDTSLSSLQ